MSAAIQMLLTALLSVAGSLTSSTAIGSIISALAAVVPTIAADAPLLLTTVKNIIAELTSSGTATTAQLAQLQQLDQQCDAAFDAAWVAFQTAYPTPPAAAPTT